MFSKLVQDKKYKCNKDLHVCDTSQRAVTDIFKWAGLFVYVVDGHTNYVESTVLCI